MNQEIMYVHNLFYIKRSYSINLFDKLYLHFTFIFDFDQLLATSVGIRYIELKRIKIFILMNKKTQETSTISRNNPQIVINRKSTG